MKATWIASLLCWFAAAVGVNGEGLEKPNDVLLFDDGFEWMRPGPLMPVVGPLRNTTFWQKRFQQGPGP